MLAVYIISAVIIFFVILSLISINAVLTISYSDGFEGAELFIKYMFIRVPLIPSGKKAVKEKEKKEDTDAEEKDSKEKSEKNMVETVKKLYYLIGEIKDDIFKILSTLAAHTITIKRFDTEAVIGTEDAMFTGIAVGTAYGALYSVLGVMDHTMNMKSFSVNIKPDWSRKIIDIGVYLKISTNIFHLLKILWMLVVLCIKLRRNKYGKQSAGNA